MTEVLLSHSLNERNSWNLAQWLFYLENLHHQEIDLGLTRINTVAQRLNIDLSFAQVITVAGTNGKGTTCAFIENALLSFHRANNTQAINPQASNKQARDNQHQPNIVAVYSSPHIHQFNERLRIDKNNVADQPLITAFMQIEAVRGDISLTYYEYTTLAALLVLMAIKPRYIILEVGLGGRLDATNIIDADIMVLTSIAIDHVNFLGDNREAIGFEKAGIMRTGKPVIIGDPKPPMSVINHAQAIQAKAIVREQDFLISEHNDNWQWQYQEYCFKELTLPFIPLANVATGLTVLAELGILLTHDNIEQWIATTQVVGRMETFNQNDYQVILDVAHNPQAATYLAQQLQKKSANNIHAVVAMMADKDIAGALSPLTEVINTWHLGELTIERAASAAVVAEHLTQLKQTSQVYENIEQAFSSACNQCLANDIIVVFGSFFTVAAIRPLLVNS